MQYIALIHKDDTSDFGVSFPDLPGCVTAGRTLDDARSMAAEALAMHIEGMLEDNEDVPAPSSLEAIMEDRENREGVAVLVDAPSRSVKSLRVNIMVPEDVLREIDRVASERGMTRSGFLVKAAKDEMKAA